jgi:hypothetical protein
LNSWTPFPHGAISQEQVDKVLVRHPELSRHILEVIDRHSVEANRDLTLELIGVGIFAGSRKVVFFSHLSLQYTSSSCAVARLAEINRITESDCR